MRHVWGLTSYLVPIVLFAMGSSIGDQSSTSVPTITQNATGLYCAWGGVSSRPIVLPPDFEINFAVAVIEITSPRREIATVTDFALLRDTGEAIPMKRVVAVNEVEGAPLATGHPRDGEMAYYLNSGTTHPWYGTLPIGKIQLRIKVSLTGHPGRWPLRFTLRVGQYSIQGPVNAAWPT